MATAMATPATSTATAQIGCGMPPPSKPSHMSVCDTFAMVATVIQPRYRLHGPMRIAVSSADRCPSPSPSRSRRWMAMSVSSSATITGTVSAKTS